MEQCDYWLPDMQTPWCDLMSGVCKCEGNEANCAIHGTSISSVLKKQEQESIKENYLRSLKKRSFKQMN